jgi:hypothetical protein
MKRIGPARISLRLIGAAIALYTLAATAQTAREVLGPSGIVPVNNQPAAKIVVDPPLADELAQGRVVIQYRTAALAVSPRIGHIHVTVDDAPWHWADTSGEPIILNGLPAGPHKVLIQLVNANHRPLDQQVVTFSIPVVNSAHNHH